MSDITDIFCKINC